MCVSAVRAGLEEDIRSPGTGVTASVSCHVGIRDWTRTLCKCSNCLAVYPAPKWSYILLSFLQHWNLFLTSKWSLLSPTPQRNHSDWFLTWLMWPALKVFNCLQFLFEQVYLFYLVYMSAWLPVCHVGAWHPQRLEVIGTLGIPFSDGCEPSCGQ